MPLPNEPYNSANEEHVKASKSKAKIAQEQKKSDLREVWGKPAGRRVMWDLLTQAGIHRISYRMGSQALMDTTFLEGMRNIGLYIEADVLGACPELYFLAQQEANQKEQKEKETNE